MFPPLPPVGRSADASFLPFEERRIIRRGAPQALRFDAPAPGWPPVSLTPPVAHAPAPMRAGSAWGWLTGLFAPRAMPMR